MTHLTFEEAAEIAHGAVLPREPMTRERACLCWGVSDHQLQSLIDGDRTTPPVICGRCYCMLDDCGHSK